MQGQYSMRSPAVKRLMKEAQELREPTELYHAQPLEDNLFEWHFTLRGPEDSEFDGGIYHGRIILPPEYPMKPPSIILLTPNGRFEVYKKICLSISGHHPESWQPSWSIRTALLAIIGFMPTHGGGAIGSLDYTPEERKVLAKKSQDWKCPDCGDVSQKLKPKTEASEKAAQEAKELASQINFQGEKPGGSQAKSSENTTTATAGTSNDTTTTTITPNQTPTSTPSPSPPFGFVGTPPPFPYSPWAMFPSSGAPLGGGATPAAMAFPRFPYPPPMMLPPPHPAMCPGLPQGFPPMPFPFSPPMMPGMMPAFFPPPPSTPSTPFPAAGIADASAAAAAAASDGAASSAASSVPAAGLQQQATSQAVSAVCASNATTTTTTTTTTTSSSSTTTPTESKEFSATPLAPSTTITATTTTQTTTMDKTDLSASEKPTEDVSSLDTTTTTNTATAATAVQDSKVSSSAASDSAATTAETDTTGAAATTSETETTGAASTTAETETTETATPAETTTTTTASSESSSPPFQETQLRHRTTSVASAVEAIRNGQQPSSASPAAPPPTSARLEVEGSYSRNTVLMMVVLSLAITFLLGRRMLLTYFQAPDSLKEGEL